MAEISVFPDPGGPVNTGPVRFGDAPAGIFIRNDHVLASYLPAVLMALEMVDRAPADTDTDLMRCARVSSRLRDLAALFESCRGGAG